MNDQTRPAVGTAIALPSDPMELMKLARELALARLIPPHFQKSPADCWLVMSFCRNRNLDFMMVVGECSVVQGRLFFSGKLTAALLNTSGYLAERLNYEYAYDDKGNPLAVAVSGRLNDETVKRAVTVHIEQVKTANKVWTTQPEQQLAYAGARIWGRRHTPEVLMGLLFEGEQPVIDVTPTEVRDPAENRGLTAGLSDLLSQAAASVGAQRQEPPVEVEPYELEHNENSSDEWKRWGNDLFAYIKAARTHQRIDEWIVANSDGFEALKHWDVGMFNKLRHMIQAVQDAKAKAAPDEPR